ncbi:CaiB/BaiF CoA-transferase family protein [uncultured Pseudacidovorax sp.]|uniref:CaiB/BaiF CoA transferase family protein n=1 Tax=uncultured Pseudacidovorax sp. TaxID=679313 RepID=UPI0025D6AB76|nr:CoA transferase [uncultured Pseudacidovorax sp.]
MAGPLAGLKIIDLTTVLMGPFATQILADLGADVIKVEPPEGDTVRHLGPMRNPGMSAGFLHVNRNKRSVVLDLKAPGDRESLLRLLQDADAFITNVRPAAMARLQLDAATIAAANPAIIQLSLVGYGQDGPYAAKAAYDDMIQAACAIPSLIAEVGDGVPRYVPLAIVDRVVGQAAATALLAALVHRLKTGEGQSVEIPMFETMVPYVMSEHMSGLTYVPPNGEPGYRRLLSPSRQAYATQDGHVCTMLYTTRHWNDFFALAGQPNRCEGDARMRTIADRTRHIDALYAEVGEVLKTRTTEYWLDVLGSADIPVMRLHTLGSIMDDPHLRAVGFFREVDHPSEGRMVEMAPMGRWSRTQPASPRPAPRLGEHGEEVFASLGQAGSADSRSTP